MRQPISEERPEFFVLFNISGTPTSHRRFQKSQINTIQESTAPLPPEFHCYTFSILAAPLLDSGRVLHMLRSLV